MERTFTRPRAGDVYRIKKRFDRSGYPVIRVKKVIRWWAYVQDCESDGTAASDKEPRGWFLDRDGIDRLRRCWMRERQLPQSRVGASHKEKT